MRVFKDLELVEHLGSGMSRILSAYSSDIFQISENFIEVCFPYENTKDFSVTQIAEESTQKSTQRIIELIKNNPNITTEMAEELKITRSAIAKQIAKLKKGGIIKRIGADKGGHWELQ